MDEAATGIGKKEIETLERIDCKEKNRLQVNGTDQAWMVAKLWHPRYQGWIPNSLHRCNCPQETCNRARDTEYPARTDPRRPRESGTTRHATENKRQTY